MVLQRCPETIPEARWLALVDHSRGQTASDDNPEGGELLQVHPRAASEGTEVGRSLIVTAEQRASQSMAAPTKSAVTAPMSNYPSLSEKGPN